MKAQKIEKGALMLAPMAGYTDVGFRALASKYGADITVTEMISSKALVYGNRVTIDLLRTAEEEKLKCVQLFGHEPEVMRDAAERDEIRPFDVVDINMGCPMPKIFGNGDGCALMNDFALAEKIIRAVKSAGKTVTVKFRLGVDGNNIVATDFARMCEASGADAVTVHGRTREQYYSGEADREEIGKVCRVVGIPVFGNGDVRTKPDVDDYMERGCFGVAVGRASQGKPQIFASLKGKEVQVDLLKDILFHVEKLSYLPPYVLACEMKKHIAAYLKGITGYRPVVAEVCKAKELDEMLSVVREFLMRNATHGEKD